jgi:hypothetical protein
MPSGWCVELCPMPSAVNRRLVGPVQLLNTGPVDVDELTEKVHGGTDWRVQDRLRNADAASEVTLGGRPGSLRLPPGAQNLVPKEYYIAEKLGLGDVTFRIEAGRYCDRVDVSTTESRLILNHVMSAASTTVSAYYRDKLILRRSVHGEVKHEMCKGGGPRGSNICLQQRADFVAERTVQIVTGNWDVSENLAEMIARTTADDASAKAEIDANLIPIKKEIAERLRKLRQALYTRLQSELFKKSELQRGAQLITGA